MSQCIPFSDPSLSCPRCGGEAWRAEQVTGHGMATMDLQEIRFTWHVECVCQECHWRSGWRFKGEDR